MENDVAKVIDRTALIENMLDQILEIYTAPRDEARSLFWAVFLNSSIMPLGSKVKVAMAICQQLDVKLNPDSLHKVLSYRNAFAHHSLNSWPTLIAGKTAEESEGFYSLRVVRNSGKFDKQPRDEAYEEFNVHYEKAKGLLKELLEAVKEDSSQNNTRGSDKGRFI